MSKATHRACVTFVEMALLILQPCTDAQISCFTPNRVKHLEALSGFPLCVSAYLHVFALSA